MGQRQIIKGVNGSPIAIGYSAAVPLGLQFINYYGGTMPQGRNMAPDGVAARVVGSPVVGTMAEGVLCKSHTAYIQSQVQQASRMTVLGVFCPTLTCGHMQSLTLTGHGQSDCLCTQSRQELPEFTIYAFSLVGCCPQVAETVTPVLPLLMPSRTMSRSRLQRFWTIPP